MPLEHPDLDFITRIIIDNPMDMLTKPKILNKNGSETHYPLRVNLRLTIEAIESISEVDMEMSVTFLMQQFWNDTRLARRNGETTIMPMALIPKMWKPDISIQGAKRAVIHGTTVDNHVMRIGKYGDIAYSVKMSATIVCQMQLSSFPMDRQVCTLSLYSFGFYADELWLFWDTYGVEI